MAPIRSKIDHLKSVGKKSNMLTCLSFHRKTKYIYYVCTCDCGKIIDVQSTAFLKEKQISCGCKKLADRKDGKTAPRKDIKKNGESSLNYLLWTYKRNAKKRGHEFLLTREEFTYLTQQNCHFCGIAPFRKVKYWNKKNSVPYIYNGIDRLDSSIGYILDNCASCCKDCNVAKNIKSVHDFLSWVKRIYDFNFSGENLL